MNAFSVKNWYLYRASATKAGTNVWIQLQWPVPTYVWIQLQKLLPIYGFWYLLYEFSYNSWYLCTGWGGELWTKMVFSIYRPSCLIEAYIRPEKYWLVWAGPLANHPFNFNFIFLATVQLRRRKERHVLRIYTAASRSYSTATNGRRAAKFA